MKHVKYYNYFKKALHQEYATTKDVLDSIKEYDRLVTYRLVVTKGNDNYWFMCNALDFILFTDELYKMIVRSRIVSASMLLDKVRQLETFVKTEYSTKELIRSSGLIKDTLKLIKVWQKALVSIQ